jgi:hypothetical protein
VNQPASNVTLKHPTGPWWTIYGTAGEIADQIAQVFPHLAINQASDFPVMVSQASAEWAQLVGATGQTPNQGNPGNQNFGNQGGGGGFSGQGNGGHNGNRGNQGGGAPGGESRFCAHGEMQWKSGTSKTTNKPYAGWFCTSSDRNNQCKPEWPDK